MMHSTVVLNFSEIISSVQVDNFLVDAACAVCSTRHTVPNSTPGIAIFGRDILFDIPDITDWTNIVHRRQLAVNLNNTRDHFKHIDFKYTVGNQVLLKKDGILRNAEDKNIGPYAITQVQTNSTIRIQRKTLSERLNI